MNVDFIDALITLAVLATSIAVGYALGAGHLPYSGARRAAGVRPGPSHAALYVVRRRTERVALVGDDCAIDDLANECES